MLTSKLLLDKEVVVLICQLKPLFNTALAKHLEVKQQNDRACYPMTAERLFPDVEGVLPPKQMRCCGPERDLQQRALLPFRPRVDNSHGSFPAWQPPVVLEGVVEVASKTLRADALVVAQVPHNSCLQAVHGHSPNKKTSTRNPLF